MALLTGCAARRPVAPAAPPVPIAPEGLRVTLVWDAPVDLDLYVTDPLGATAYYGNPGAVFAGDARCDGPAVPVRTESAGWRTPRPGRYRIGVDFPERCRGTADAVVYRLLIDVQGRRDERTATARHLVRDNVVVEVEVP